MDKKKSSTNFQHLPPVAHSSSSAPGTPVSEPSQPQGFHSQQNCLRTVASLLGNNAGFEESRDGSGQQSDRLSTTETRIISDKGVNLRSIVPSDNLIRSCLAHEVEKDLISEDEGTSSDEVSTLCKLHETLEKNLCAQDWRPPDDQFSVNLSGSDIPTAELPVLPADKVDKTPNCDYDAQRPFGPVKRGVDHGTPSAKRTRCTPDMSLLQPSRLASPPSGARHAARGLDSLQWSGPSTSQIHCQDGQERGVPLSLAIVGIQDEDVAEVVFRPPYRILPDASPPTVRPDCPRRRLLRIPVCAPVSPVASKRWPYTATASVGMVDTHCHLDFLFRKLSFKGTFAKFRLLNEDTFPACYEACVAIFCNPLTFGDRMVWEDLLQEDGIWAAFGCHPHMVRDYDQEADKHLIKALQHPRVVALGEIGLDYSHKNYCQRGLQKTVFQRQIGLALERKLPLVIHSREAAEDTLNILKERIPRDYRVHRHCFTGDWEEASEWLDTFPGLCLGLTPLLCFAHSGPLQEVARRIPLDRLLLETDAPYFLPRTESGAMRHSHPGMAIHVAVRVSALKDIPLDDVLRAVRTNTRRIYGI